MRYLHTAIDDLLDYLESRRLVLAEVGIQKPWISPIGLESLKRYYALAQKLWGAAPDSFIVAGEKEIAEHISLKDAVRNAEEAGRPELVLVGYQDDGLISISRDTLPFQNNARPADWWQPW